MKYFNHQPKTITWYINEHCNYQCSYCDVWKSENNKKNQHINIQKLEKGLELLEAGWRFCITGGEPFLEKNILEICKTICQKHQLAGILTNLSLVDVDDFSSTIPPEKCGFIDVSVHISEREKRDKKLESFLKKILFLQHKGYDIQATYVAYPELFDRIEADFLMLKNKGIKNLKVKNFVGVYDNKQYPASYIRIQRQTMLKLGMDDLEKAVLFNKHHYLGRLCSAGNRFFAMDREGNLKRCAGSTLDYGNIFDKTMRIDGKIRACDVPSHFCLHDCINRSLPPFTHRIKRKLKI
jgi:MoaA/NifB/PqqE/SkfB family radical SAM enzyme